MSFNAAWADELAAVVQDLVSRADRGANERVIEVADAAQIARLREIGFPAVGRPLPEVVDQLLQDILPYRARPDHPRFFAFVPSPASPLSWIGELLAAAHNTHMGSWLQSSGASCIEQQTVAWLAAQVGFPAAAGGLFVSGGSIANLTALAVARDQRLDEAGRTTGVAYVSEQTHSSASKALRIVGLVDRQIHKIAVDNDFRMDCGRLASAIAADRAAGLTPFAVVATAGTTNTGSIDPLVQIADLCDAYGLWLHVDGAYGASLALSPSRRELIAGIERADSLSWDAHKWLFQTYGCGVILVRQRRHLLDTFHSNAEYLRDADTAGDDVNYWDLGPELTRPARAIRLWLTLQVLGVNAVGAAIDHGCRLAEWAADELRKLPDWYVVSGPQLAIVTFRFAPPGIADDVLDGVHRAISGRMLKEGFASVLTTQLRGQTVLRICAIHPETTEGDMRETVRRLNVHARAVWDG